MKRRQLLQLGTAGALGAAGVAVHAQAAWPNKPIRIIVGYAAGGGNDVLARLLAQKLQESLGQTVVVENRPGVAAIVGTDAVAKAPPDGYTLMVTASGPIVFNPALYAKLPYAPRDFAPVSLMVRFPLLLVVKNDGPRNLAELVAFSKANPEKTNYGSSAASFRLVTELLKSKAGLSAEHVPYKGSNESVNAVVGGQVTMTLCDPLPAVGPMKGGLVRAIGVTSARRTALLPDVPTLAEQGVDLDITLWSGLMAPAGTPPAIVQRLSAEVQRINRLPEMRERFATLMVEDASGPPEAFARTIEAELPLWAQVARANNIKAD
ncbi:tripartite tricarboxylate transporter substrate binding protein [Aquabacterium sp. J223]|uniref:Bug family tripartite tricarboxylate transporter substrate binding protein n=1 Tax=Aquabacterium sp. J223 TaxID=2898431 RepID=UPI0021ADAFC4|nr:tripartite tricarboxylate transporter substrate binding protein [Aquabacterium sp. J223]UUX95138.1 tripartite tricarboxylate transporter substrate binding protein [Aquabacterium sp. J223]